MATVSPPWKYEPRSARREREAAEFAQYAHEQGQTYLAPPEQPQPKRKGLLSRAVDVAKETGSLALSGEKFINKLDVLQEKYLPLPWDNPAPAGTAARGALEKLPVIGDIAGTAFDVATSPATLATAGVGGAVGGALRGGTAGAAKAGLLRRAAATLVEPIAMGRGPLGRLAVETAAGTAGIEASKAAGELLPEDTPGPVRAGVALGAGLAGGVAAVGAIRAGERSLARAPGKVGTIGAERVLKRRGLPTEEMGAIGKQAGGVSDSFGHSGMRTSALGDSGYAYDKVWREMGFASPQEADQFSAWRASADRASRSRSTLIRLERIERAGQRSDPASGLQIDKAIMEARRDVIQSEQEVQALYRPVFDDRSGAISGAGRGPNQFNRLSEGTVSGYRPGANQADGELQTGVRETGQPYNVDQAAEDAIPPRPISATEKAAATRAIKRAEKELAETRLRVENGSWDPVHLERAQGELDYAKAVRQRMAQGDLDPYRLEGTAVESRYARPAAVTPTDIHKLADAKGVPWDNDPDFLAFTKRITGKEHLDDLAPEELARMRDAVESLSAAPPTPPTLPPTVAGGRPPEPPEGGAVVALLSRIKGAKPLQEQNKELLSKFHSRQAGAFAGALGEGESGFARGMGAMRGQAERIGFEPLRPVIGQAGVDELYDRLTRSALRPFEHASAGHALGNILDGVVPVPSELTELERAFPGLMQALQEAKIISGPGIGAEIRDVLSAPQSIMSSYDLSGLRQTATFAYAHPVQWSENFKQSLSAAAKEENYLAIMDDIENSWDAPLMRDAGVVFSRGEQALTGTERTWASKILNAVPGYRPSQRAFSALVNLSRRSVFRDMMKESGYGVDDIPADELRRWGRLANVSTGRGDPLIIGEMIKETSVLNTPLFWAPRLIISRVQMPFELFSSSPIVRQEAARQIVAFVGINGTILGLGKAAGLWDVEGDPRSADFGQMRFGAQRIDPWAGFRPIANLVARLATGERKSTTTGEFTDVDAKQIVQDFLRQKLSPVTSTGINIWTGEDAIGNRYGLKDVPGDVLVPLFLQQLVEAARTGDPFIVARTVPGAIGLGVNYYESTMQQALNRHPDLGTDYTKLSASEKLELRRLEPEIAAEADRETLARGGPAARSLQMKAELNRQQAADDQQLLSGGLTRDKWIEQYQDRRAELRFRQEENWKGLPKGPARDAVGRYFETIKASENPDTGVPDWDAVDAWVATQNMSDQRFIEENTGLGGTPLTQVYRKLAKVKGEYYDLPKYRGYTADQARSIDAVYATVAAEAGSTDDAKMLRALRKYTEANNLDRSDPTLKAVRRLILSMVSPASDRKRFAKVHPELALFDSYTRAPLTAAERALVNTLLADPEIQRRAAP